MKMIRRAYRRAVETVYCETRSLMRGRADDEVGVDALWVKTVGVLVVERSFYALGEPVICVQSFHVAETRWAAVRTAVEQATQLYAFLAADGGTDMRGLASAAYAESRRHSNLVVMRPEDDPEPRYIRRG